MSPMPDGWSVDVEGTRVVVRVSGRPHDWFWLSTGEIKTLIIQLQLAHVIAHRRELVESDPDALTSEVQRDIDAHLEMYGRYAVDELAQADIDYWTGQIVSGDELWQRFALPESNPSGDPPISVAPDGSDDAETADASGSATTGEQVGAGLPAGWNIRSNGDAVRFVVPASAADGEFQISRSEAAAVGVAMLWLSAPRQFREELIESRIANMWRGRLFRAFSARVWGGPFEEPGVDLSDEERGSTE